MLCLARAYLAEGNPFWAMRVLQRRLESHPGDCAARAWLAWTYLAEAFAEDAAAVLEQPGCPDHAGERARWALLSALIARVQGAPARVADSLRAAGRSGTIFPEDDARRRMLLAEIAPQRPAPVRLRLELAGGASSDPAAGSPDDPVAGTGASGWGSIDLLAWLDWNPGWIVRPALELGLQGIGYQAEEAEPLSYLQLTGRPAAALDLDGLRLLAGYRFATVLMEEGDRSWLSRAHRAELDLEGDSWVVFAGGGRREFAQQARTRIEADLGAGGTLLALGWMRLMLTGLVRVHQATDDPYDRVGVRTGSVAWIALGAGLTSRLGCVAGADLYPRSGGIAGELAYGIEDKRVDLFARLSAGLWSPSWNGVRAGLSYRLAWRDSTADAPGSNYDYLDHQIQLGVRWTWRFDPWGPRVIRPHHHLALPVAPEEAAGGLDEERVRDLLRRDRQDVRGACGCGS